MVTTMLRGPFNACALLCQRDGRSGLNWCESEWREALPSDDNGDEGGYRVELHTLQYQTQRGSITITSLLACQHRGNRPLCCPSFLLHSQQKKSPMRADQDDNPASTTTTTTTKDPSVVVAEAEVIPA